MRWGTGSKGAALLVLAGLPAVAGELPVPVASDVLYTPLTITERWQNYWDDSIHSPRLYLASLGAAGFEQLTNAPPEWKQGVEGYAKRAASESGEFAISTTIRQGGSALLGYEPRYIRSGQKGFAPRFGHALRWSFLTWDSNREVRFNLPAVAAAYGSGMISDVWFPGRFHVLTDGVREGNVQMGLAVGVNVVREFGPDLKRFLRLGK